MTSEDSEDSDDSEDSEDLDLEDEEEFMEEELAGHKRHRKKKKKKSKKKSKKKKKKKKKKNMKSSVADALIGGRFAPTLHAVKLMNAIKEDPAHDIPCKDETMALFACISEDCSNCFAKIMKDVDEETTCAELKSGSFCKDMGLCVTGSCSEFDCSAQAKEFDTCVAKQYPDHCPGLCKSEYLTAA